MSKVNFSVVNQSYKVNSTVATQSYKVSFTLTNSNVNYEYHYGWIYPAIKNMLWQDEEIVAMVHEQNGQNNYITALIVLRDTQPSPSVWLPQLLEENLEDDESLENFVEVEVPDDLFADVKKSIVSKILKYLN